MPGVLPSPVVSSSLVCSVDKENSNPNVRYISTGKSKSSNPLDWLSEAQREMDEEQALKAQKKYDAEHEKLLSLKRDEEIAKEFAKQFESQAQLAEAKERENEEIARKLAEKLAADDTKLLKQQAVRASQQADSDLKLAKKLQAEEKKLAEIENKKQLKERETLWKQSRITVENDGNRVKFWILLPYLDNANVNFEHDESGSAQLSINAKPVKSMKLMEQEFGVSLILYKQDGFKEFDLKEEDIEVDYNEKTGLLQIWCAKVRLASIAAEISNENQTNKVSSGGWIRKLRAALLKKE
jgi:hypothetical protein